MVLRRALDQARTCPTKGKNSPAKLLGSDDIAATSLDVWGFSLTCEPVRSADGFTRVGRPAIPRPFGANTGGVMELAFQNKFGVLGNDNAPKTKKNKQQCSNSRDMGPSSEHVCN